MIAVFIDGYLEDMLEGDEDYAAGIAYALANYLDGESAVYMLPQEAEEMQEDSTLLEDEVERALEAVG